MVTLSNVEKDWRRWYCCKRTEYPRQHCTFSYTN